jgi:RND family efflux transporter MFP subunit
MPYSSNEPSPATRTGGRLKLVGVGVAAVAILAVAGGLISRSMADQKLRNWTTEQATPTVALAAVKAAASDGKLVLPAQIEAFNNATINARASGYLRRWNVDIGARVKAGQLLAEIDTPEIDQQLLQARANLASAEANLKLAQSTNARWDKLLAQQAVSKQDADEKAGDLSAKSALANAAKANVDQLVATKAFARIVAPFDGVVTARTAQIGQLVSNTGTTSPLFTIADDTRLRVYVRVPQTYLGQIGPGATAQLVLPEYPGRTFSAKLVGSAEAVSSQTGTLLAQLELDNPDHAVKPGEYAQATFQVGSADGAVQVPSSALMFRQDGMMVAVVWPDNRVHLQKVVIGRDLGASVELASGLNKADRIIDNPADTLNDGDVVRIAQPAPVNSAAPPATH